MAGASGPIKIQGSLNEENVEVLRLTLQHSVPTCPGDSLHLDLSGLSEMDTTGLRLLIGLAVTCRERGVRPEVSLGSARQQEMFSTFQLDRYVHVTRRELK